MKKEYTFFAVFLVLWALIEPILAILKPEEINPIIPKLFLIVLFAVPLIIHLLYKYVLNNKCKYKNLRNSVKKAIKSGLNYLEKININEDGHRLRHTPSLMETSTVLGAIYLAKKTLNKNINEDIELSISLIGDLKKQFSGECPVKYFDCFKCRNQQICNVGFFDYLSHLYFAKDTILYSKLENEFVSLINIFEERLIKYDHLLGWTLYQNETQKIDSLSTSTILILLYTFKYDNNDNIEQVLKTLIELQDKNGSWKRDFEEDEYCAGNIEIITTHRVIECFILFKNKFISINFDDSIQKAIQFLKSSSGYEKPVNYELRSNMNESELLRGLGHIIQALTKANISDDILEEYIKFILCKQQTNGSFIGTTNALDCNKELNYNTDLTAFIVRTLCIYSNNLKS